MCRLISCRWCYAVSRNECCHAIVWCICWSVDWTKGSRACVWITLESAFLAPWSSTCRCCILQRWTCKNDRAVWCQTSDYTPLLTSAKYAGTKAKSSLVYLYLTCHSEPNTNPAIHGLRAILLSYDSYNSDVISACRSVKAYIRPVNSDIASVPVDVELLQAHVSMVAHGEPKKILRSHFLPTIFFHLGEMVQSYAERGHRKKRERVVSI